MTTFRLSNPTGVAIEQKATQQKMKHQKRPAEVSDNRPKRKRITPEQFCLLTELFQQTDTPNHELRESLAKRLNMTNREVQVWFQNRRAKVNRIRLQKQEQGQITNNKKRVKFNYWSSNTSSSSSSSLTASPLLPNEFVFDSNVTPIDILATAAVYVQRWEESEFGRKEKQQAQQEKPIPPPPSPPSKKHKSWRPWL